jgi:hypothetical protein
MTTRALSGSGLMRGFLRAIGPIVGGGSIVSGRPRVSLAAEGVVTDSATPRADPIGPWDTR